MINSNNSLKNTAKAVGMFPRGFATNTSFASSFVRADHLVTLNYGKALVEKNRTPGKVPVYGTNGQCGWHNKSLVQGPGVILGRRGRIVSLIEQVAAVGIRGSDLAKLTVFAPPIKIQRCFGVLVEPLEKKMASNDTESRTLASIRDALLPKLLSGEIRVKEAERLVEAVA